MMKDLEQKTGSRMSVVTISSVTAYPAGDADTSAFSSGIFDDWNMGDSGILMLISKDDREMKIELGGSFGPLYELVMQQVMQYKMIPFFRQGYYSRGIYEGAREVISKVSGKVSFFNFYWKEITGGAAAVVAIVIAVILSRVRKKSGVNAGANDVKPAVKGKIVTGPAVFGGGAWGEW
jgi:uncharacterized protein